MWGGRQQGIKNWGKVRLWGRKSSQKRGWLGMLMILLYKEISAYFSSLLPCLFTHLSHLSSITAFLKTYNVLSCLCASHVYSPYSGHFSIPQSLPRQLLPPPPSPGTILSPCEALQSPRHCRLLLPPCSLSRLLSALVIWDTFSSRQWGSQWQEPSLTCLWILCWT